ncbi:hypothetical protein ABZ646_04610 [Streptomyces sp. NPDC007162]|uniref:hypothetical protein n=1 Tax=Streptomyces sp. NPDC007162 TaxID=3156917 RepID=UPI0033C24720
MADRQEQTAPDAVLTRIGQVVMLHHAGDREEARGRLLDLWAEIGEHGDPLHRCTLAHYLADTQDDPADELAWDLRALSAADEARGTGQASEEDAAEEGDEAAGVRGFYPSLHLNLAADYVKLGRTEAARTHLRRARGAAAALADDGYGDGVRAAIRRLERRLGDDDGPDGESSWGPPRQRPS